MHSSEPPGEKTSCAELGSVSRWLIQLKTGDPVAAQPLWERYFQQLVELARRKLRQSLRRAADEEDIALSAFDSVCRGAAVGRFPTLHDSNDLWHLLVTITDRKAIDLARRERRAKRGGGAVLDEAALKRADESGIDDPIRCHPGREPNPAFAAELAEECSRLLGLLNDSELRSIAIWKMEGLSIDEIAARLGCVSRTVDRRLKLIRIIWEDKTRND